MAIDDVYQMTVTYRTTAGIMQNTLAFIRTEATEPAQAGFQTLGEAIRQVHKQAQNIGVTYTGWKARQVRGANVTWPSGTDCSPVGGNYFEGLLTTAGAGGTSGDMLPPQCALVTTLKTATIGRTHRGRFYAGGFGEGDQSGGIWNVQLTDAITTAWGTFFTAYGSAAPTSGFKLGIWSYRTASGCTQSPTGSGHVRVESPNPAQAFTPVTSLLVRNTVYTQRRRVAGVGL